VNAASALAAADGGVLRPQRPACPDAAVAGTGLPPRLPLPFPRDARRLRRPAVPGGLCP